MALIASGLTQEALIEVFYQQPANPCRVPWSQQVSSGILGGDHIGIDMIAIGIADLILKNPCTPIQPSRDPRPKAASIRGCL
jgi:hypothetical protein